MIKVYKFNNEFGKVGSYISSCIDNNQTVDINFSYGKIVYIGNGEFLHKVELNNNIVTSLEHWEKKKYNSIGFIASGTGITPILRIINESLKLKEDENIRIKLLFINYTKEEL